jgi:hypothetical protein
MNRPMRLVSKLETTEICSENGLHNRCFLCDLSGDPPRDFDSISLTGIYPRGAKLFVEGQRPKGVFILSAPARIPPAIIEGSRDLKSLESRRCGILLTRCGLLRSLTQSSPIVSRLSSVILSTLRTMFLTFSLNRHIQH